MKVRFLALFSLLFVIQLNAAEPRPVPAPPIIGATSYLVIDSKTGYQLASLEPDNAVPPASLTKMMTAFVVFSALADQQIALQE